VQPSDRSRQYLPCRKKKYAGHPPAYAVCEASKTSNPKIAALQKEIELDHPNARLNLQGLSNLRATVGNTETDSNMLDESAEHMASSSPWKKYQKATSA